MLASLALIALLQDVPRFPPHYAAQPTECPVGGEKFNAPALMHYSTYGAMPDGQPFGSIEFPILMGECPGNGLPLFKKFSAEEVGKLGPLLASDAYKAMRGTETPYYRAHWLANSIGDSESATWLLLSATWEAKNADPESAQAKRYNAAFAALASKAAADSKSLESVVLRLRAANALRELGRFDEAEALRASVIIAPDAGGAGASAKRNREGWTGFRDSLAAPIARHDAARVPIDLLEPRQAAFRCLGQDGKPPVLSAFEQEYCARPEIAKQVEDVRALRKKYQ